ncbi:hypothetical protein [Pengzhenrongella sp.]|uniref:hypothetical protein n=1 Tax=Pengzhenrongella sp. TaxID=2888820 RepID=UPI0039C940B8
MAGRDTGLTAANLANSSYVVEMAPDATIVNVKVGAGNDGESGPSALTMPAIDPFVIAVGSVDHEGTGNAGDLRVGAWTSTGTAARRPDLTAPGKSVVPAPRSRADQCRRPRRRLRARLLDPASLCLTQTGHGDDRVRECARGRFRGDDAGHRRPSSACW